MSKYSYTAMATDGREMTGRIEAATVDEARRLLEQQGLQVRDVSLAGETLNADETEELARSVAQVSAARVPLGLGLRAAADESSSRRVAAALRVLAGRVDEGRSLDEALQATGEMLPRHLRGLLLAAQRTGRMAEALADLVELRSMTGSLRRGIVAAFAYPLVVACLGLAVMAFIGTSLAGTFEKMFGEFELQLPVMTLALFWWYRVGMWLVAGVVGIGVRPGRRISLAVGSGRLGPVGRLDSALRPARLLAVGRRMVRSVGGARQTPGSAAGGLAHGCRGDSQCVCGPVVGGFGRRRGQRPNGVADAGDEPPLAPFLDAAGPLGGRNGRVWARRWRPAARCFGSACENVRCWCSPCSHRVSLSASPVASCSSSVACSCPW